MSTLIFINYCHVIIYNMTITYVLSYYWGLGSVVVKALLDGRFQDRFPVVSLGIFYSCPEVDSASESEYQDFSWGKGGQCVWLTTYHPCSAENVKKSGALNYPEPLGPPRPVAGFLYFTLLYFTLLYFTLYFTFTYHKLYYTV